MRNHGEGADFSAMRVFSFIVYACLAYLMNVLRLNIPHESEIQQGVFLSVFFVFIFFMGFIGMDYLMQNFCKALPPAFRKHPFFTRPVAIFNFILSSLVAALFFNAIAAHNPQGAYNDDYEIMIFYGLSFFAITYTALMVVEFLFVSCCRLIRAGLRRV